MATEYKEYMHHKRNRVEERRDLLFSLRGVQAGVRESEKWCRNCKQWQDKAAFDTCEHSLDGLQNWCKACIEEAQQERKLDSRRKRTEVNPIRVVVLQALLNASVDAPLSASEIAGRTKLSSYTVTGVLSNTKQSGLVDSRKDMGTYTSYKWHVWWLTDAGWAWLAAQEEDTE